MMMHAALLLNIQKVATKRSYSSQTEQKQNTKDWKIEVDKYNRYVDNKDKLSRLLSCYAYAIRTG